MIVPDDQLSLAIGREGQNARLAARLTGWRVDIRSETEFAKEETEGGYGEEEEDVGGRCAAILGNGRRCPNAALPGSRYCGLDAHQALEGKDTDVVGARPDGHATRVGQSAPSTAWGAASAPRRRVLRRFATVEGARRAGSRARAARARRLAARVTSNASRPRAPAAASTAPSEAPVTIPKDTVDFTQTWPRSASTS